MAVEILARLGVFDVLVEGWDVPDDVARDLSEAPGPEEAWAGSIGAGLALAPGADRARV